MQYLGMNPPARPSVRVLPSMKGVMLLVGVIIQGRPVSRPFTGRSRPSSDGVVWCACIQYLAMSPPARPSARVLPSIKGAMLLVGVLIQGRPISRPFTGRSRPSSDGVVWCA